MKNERVREAMFRASISQTALAKELSVDPANVSIALSYELAPEEQDRLIRVIGDIVRKREQSKCDGNANA